MKQTHRGTFFTLDGIDGSGKATQAALLVKRLRKEGHRVHTIDFPQYGKKSAGMVEEYLHGKYGEADAINPYLASIFYACDRYDASFNIRRWLDTGNIVIADRYITANFGHQGGKLLRNHHEWKRFIAWDSQLEYEVFNIPKPTVGLILKSDPAISRKLLLGGATHSQKEKKRTGYLKGKKRDALERNGAHQANALASFLLLAKTYPKDFAIIDCIEDARMLPPEVIHERVWNTVRRYI